MFPPTHRGRNAGAQPVWLRALGVLCLLLITVVGVAQAAHIHGDWLPQHAAQASSSQTQAGDTGEVGCPLCVAMHSALPVAGFAALLLGLLLTASVPANTGRKPDLRWHFAAFSRPPPSLRIL
jgi:hypothetical protein